MKNSMNMWLMVGVIAAVSGFAFAEPNKSIPVPSKGQLVWHEQERIMFVHFGPATWQG